METNLASAINITTNQARYDTAIKELLADKQILARILKYSLKEFENYTIDDIIDCIDEPQIGNVRLEPGHTNTEKIKSENTVDDVLGEGKIYYDVRFSVYHKNTKVKVLINIEAQGITKPGSLGYNIDNRIIYYLSRMVSAQKEVEFTNSNYDDIKAVRSIWICMDAAKSEESINRIVLGQDTIWGTDAQLDNLDKFQGVIIRIRKRKNIKESQNELIAMLEALIKKEDADIKKKILSEKFGLIMTKNTERKVSNMCNWSELLVEEGIEQGIEQGIRILIEDNIEEGKSKDIIIGKLIRRYGLSEEVAKKYIDEVCAISL